MRLSETLHVVGRASCWRALHKAGYFDPAEIEEVEVNEQPTRQRGGLIVVEVTL